MAAPDSTPGLSVVSDDADSASQAPERPGPVARKSESKKSERRGAPWWLVAVVAVVGVILFLTQYQRAERLGARVASLTEELLASDQRLETANLHLAAHQSHLQRVRASVSALSDQVMGLQALTDRDPLAPVTEAAPEASAVQPSDSASEAVPTDETIDTEPSAPEPAQSASGVLTGSDGYYWRADAAAAEPIQSDSDRRAIADGAVGTSFLAD